jgi:hypothetical protein
MVMGAGTTEEISKKMYLQARSTFDLNVTNQETNYKINENSV